MFHALRQSAGKRPGQRLVIAGTRAPSVRGNWWPGLLDAGSGDGIHVTEFSPAEGDPWDAWPTIRRCNPMVLHNATLRKAILRERDQARRDETLRSAFRAYRLNEQIDTFNSVLVGAETWRRVEARDVPPREGRPVVGLDLGSERSWSAAWALWRNGRSECYAVCPGVPDLSERERQDAMPRGLYRRLAADGVLLVDEGLRVSRPATLIDHLVSVGIRPAVMLCDRFLIASLKDEVRGRWPLVPRVTRWSEGTEDISAFRRLAADGPLSVAPQCQGLARVSLSEASVVSDDQGSCRLEKKRNRRSRDDVAVAGTLAAGAIARELRRPAPRTAALRRSLRAVTASARAPGVPALGARTPAGARPRRVALYELRARWPAGSAPYHPGTRRPVYTVRALQHGGALHVLSRPGSPAAALGPRSARGARSWRNCADAYRFLFLYAG